MKKNMNNFPEDRWMHIPCDRMEMLGNILVCMDEPIKKRFLIKKNTEER